MAGGIRAQGHAGQEWHAAIPLPSYGAFFEIILCSWISAVPWVSNRRRRGAALRSLTQSLLLPHPTSQTSRSQLQNQEDRQPCLPGSQAGRSRKTLQGHASRMCRETVRKEAGEVPFSAPSLMLCHKHKHTLNFWLHSCLGLWQPN